MVTGDGLIQLSQFFERNPKVAKRLGEMGHDVEGLEIAGYRLIQLPQFL